MLIEYRRHNVAQELDLAIHGAEPASASLIHRRGVYLGDGLPEFCDQERLFRLLNLLEQRETFRLEFGNCYFLHSLIEPWSELIVNRRIALACDCKHSGDHESGSCGGANESGRACQARTKSEVQRIEAQVKAENQRVEAEAQATATRLQAQAAAEAQRVTTEAEVAALHQREQAAKAYKTHPALMRLQELETLRELARTANARIYIGFDKHLPVESPAEHNDQ